MKYSSLIERISGEGADAWVVHYEARRALDRGESVILLSVGDPDLDSPAPVIERAIDGLRTGDTHYTPVAGREPLRAAIAALHRARCGQPVDPDNVIFLAGAQNALFAASLLEGQPISYALARAVGGVAETIAYANSRGYPELPVSEMGGRLKSVSTSVRMERLA